MTRTTRMIGPRAVTLALGTATADGYWQAVNPATGRPWQAKRDLTHFEGPRAPMQGLLAWNRCLNQAAVVQRQQEGRP